MKGDNRVSLQENYSTLIGIVISCEYMRQDRNEIARFNSITTEIFNDNMKLPCVNPCYSISEGLLYKLKRI